MSHKTFPVIFHVIHTEVDNDCVHNNGDNGDFFERKITIFQVNLDSHEVHRINRKGFLGKVADNKP